MPRLIDADALVKTLNEVLDEDPSLSKVLLVRFAEQILNDTPTVDAEPVRHGHWVVDEDGNIKCSECGHYGVGDDYCERCGAKMDGKRKKEI